MKYSHKSMGFSQLPFFFRVALCMLIARHVAFANKSRLVIGGFAGINVQNEGWSSAGVIPAIELALERVNNNSNILNDYNLEIDWKDTRCASEYAIKSLHEHITKSPPYKIAFLGPGCSVAAEPIAATVRFWNLIQIAFSLTSPDLSNKKRFPNLYHINPSGTTLNPAILALTNKLKWERIFIVKHDQRIFSSLAESLKMSLRAGKKKVHLINYISNTTSVINPLMRRDARIVFLLMYESDARKIICAAYQKQFYDTEIVWILRGWYSKNWWTVDDKEVPCTLEQIKEAMTNVIYVDHVDYIDEDTNVLGLTKSQFKKKYNESIRMKNNMLYQINKYAPYGYDAVVMLSHALNATEERLKRKNQSLSEFTYARSDITDILKEKITKMDNIKGLTGDIKLDKRGGRTMTNVWLQQLQGNKVVNVALYNTENNSIALMPSKKFIWAGGKIPQDERTKTASLPCLSRPMFWWSTIASIGGIFAAFYFLWVNVKNGSERFFKMSSPPLNNFMILGAIISYIYVPIHGIKSCTMEETAANSILCKVDAFLISIAFSLIFGAIFVKTWRIYKIFTNTKLSKQLRFLSNKHLMILVIIMVIFDSIYILAWSVNDPLEDSVVEVLEEKDKTMHKVYYAHKCTSVYYPYWFGGMVGYKGLLMLFGMFLTWETRNVSFPGLNDSKYIGICVYNIFIVSVVVLPVVLLAFPDTDVDACFGVTVGSILFCTTATLILMFFSKIRPDTKTDATPSNTTMSIDNSVFDATTGGSTIGQCPTCKKPYL